MLRCSIIRTCFHTFSLANAAALRDQHRTADHKSEEGTKPARIPRLAPLKGTRQIDCQEKQLDGPTSENLTSDIPKLPVCPDALPSTPSLLLSRAQIEVEHHHDSSERNQEDNEAKPEL
jgi:hypothetical protein